MKRAGQPKPKEDLVRKGGGIPKRRQRKAFTSMETWLLGGNNLKGPERNHMRGMGTRGFKELKRKSGEETANQGREKLCVSVSRDQHVKKGTRALKHRRRGNGLKDGAECIQSSYIRKGGPSGRP